MATERERERERERYMMIVIRQLDRYIDRNLRILGGLGNNDHTGQEL